MSRILPRERGTRLGQGTDRKLPIYGQFRGLTVFSELLPGGSGDGPAVDGLNFTKVL
jgi:hypothetical protein